MKLQDLKTDRVIVSTVKEALSFNEVYLFCIEDEDDGDFTLQEVHDGDYYVGGDGFGFVNCSNIGFDSVEEVELYYERNYSGRYLAFSEESEREEFLEINKLY